MTITAGLAAIHSMVKAHSPRHTTSFASSRICAQTECRPWPNSVFPIANGMADTAIGFGWRRLAKASEGSQADCGLENSRAGLAQHPAQTSLLSLAKAQRFRVTKVLSNPYSSCGPLRQYRAELGNPDDDGKNAKIGGKRQAGYANRTYRLRTNSRPRAL